MEPDEAFSAAVAAQTDGRLAEAEAAYRAVIATSEHPASLHNLAVILEQTGRIEEAGEALGRAAAAAPDRAQRHLVLAGYLRKARRFAEAEAAYRRAIALDPDDPMARFELGCVLLATGRFEDGWPLYESRPARAKALAEGLPFPEWQGESLAGKRLMVLREQGFGDQIMAARFLPGLEAASVTYVGFPQLRRLFEQLPVTFMNLAEAGAAVKAGPPPWDYWVLAMSLPDRLKATPETLPPPPYFKGRANGAAGRIGVAWRGEPSNQNDAFRSLTPDQAAPLLALPGAVSLDPQTSGAADFQATADLIAGLDVVISVDTAVAHLAGAMGKPVWVLLARHALDWQWPREGTSPWYPQARLFVQPSAGDWSAVVSAVCAAVS